MLLSFFSPLYIVHPIEFIYKINW